MDWKRLLLSEVTAGCVAQETQAKDKCSPLCSTLHNPRLLIPPQTAFHKLSGTGHNRMIQPLRHYGYLNNVLHIAAASVSPASAAAAASITSCCPPLARLRQRRGVPAECLSTFC